MQVRLDEIAPQGNHYTLQEGDWFPYDEITLSSECASEVTLRRTASDTVELDGKITAQIVHNCDRCGSEYTQLLEKGFSAIFKRGVDTSLGTTEFECTSEDLDTVFLDVDEPLIDIYDVLRQQVFLALPERRLCDEQCKGMCPRCGTDLNRSTCRCSEENPDSPFAVLNTLRKNK